MVRRPQEGSRGEADRRVDVPQDRGGRVAQLRLRRIARVLDALPPLSGDPIAIGFAPHLTATRGGLASGGSGQPVHAGSDLRRRAIVLDSALRGTEFRRILIHELFHFVWRRLGNPARREWEAVLVREFERRARGELGWAAESRKLQLTPEARAARSPSWRAYACEAFCETAAWLWCGSARHREFTLAARHCEARRQWFRNRMAGGRIQL